MHRIAAICALAAFVPGITIGDDTFRCGSYLITTPLSVEDLLKKCGEPSSKKVITDDVRTRVGAGGTRSIGTTTSETWRYERRAGDFPMIVTINDGVIVSIERGEK